MSTAEQISLAPPGADAPRPYTDYYNATYEIISTVAYLAGVEKRHFENEYEPPKPERYQALEKNKSARIIRNLCMLRTAFEQNYTAIRHAFYWDVKNIGSLPDLLPSQSVQALEQDGITLYLSKPRVEEYLILINKELSNRINSVQGLFPEWLKWAYVRDLFLMPGGTKYEGLKAAARDYNSDRNRFPYQCYLNWSGTKQGNILHSDEKFVTLLYELHEDYFEDKSLVTNAGNITLNNIYSYLESSNRCVMVVDCENSDPIKLAAVLSSLSSVQRQKIIKIMLFDSEYTTTGWKVLSKAGSLPITHINVQRLNQKKSLVDMKLATETCKEVYSNHVDSVILVSSDSDYWALIQTLSDVNFLVMVEHGKCGSDIKDALTGCGIYYCYIDDFCTGASYAIKTTALLDEVRERLNRRINFNAKTLMEDALHSTWVQMTPREQQQFYERYLKKMRLSLDADGNISVVIDS